VQDTPEDTDLVLDWEKELHDFVRLQVICARADTEDKARQRRDLHQW
jgi:hypothetical protein